MAGVKLLIDKTRDTKAYPLVYKENVQCSSCRNLYGMQKMAIVTSLLCAVTSSVAGFLVCQKREFSTSAVGVCGCEHYVSRLVAHNHKTCLGERASVRLRRAAP